MDRPLSRGCEGGFWGGALLLLGVKGVLAGEVLEEGNGGEVLVPPPWMGGKKEGILCIMAVPPPMPPIISSAFNPSLASTAVAMAAAMLAFSVAA